MASSNEFHVSLPFNGKNYDLQLVEGEKSDYTVKINGRTYSVFGPKDKLRVACEIISAVCHEPISSQEDLQKKLSTKTASFTSSTSKSSQVFLKYQSVNNIQTKPPLELYAARLEKKLAPSIPEGSGAMVALFQRGEEPAFINLGKTRVEGGIVPDKNTAALIGSGAKMFTALLSKILEEKGLLVIEESPNHKQSKLSDFLEEEYFQIFNDPESAKNITLESLLSHTSGLQYSADDNDNSRSGQSIDTILSSLVEEIKRNPSKAIKFTNNPDDKIYSYSNQIGLVALCIEKAYNKQLARQSELTGIPQKYMTYAEILNQELLQPLGMDRTGFQRPNDSNILEACVIKEGKKPITVEEDIRDPMMQGAGGLWSTPADLMRLASGFTSEGNIVAQSGDQLISREGVSKLMEVRGINGKTGLALDVEGKVIGKGGGISTYDFKFRYDTSTGNAMMSMCNFTGAKKEFDDFVNTAVHSLEELNPTLIKDELQDVAGTIDPSTVQEAISEADMNRCDEYFVGKQGFAGVKRTKFGVVINWNGIKLPAKKMREHFVIFDGGVHDGKMLLFKEGKGANKTPYLFIEKGIDSVGFTLTTKENVIVPQPLDISVDMEGVEGVFSSPHPDGPKPIQVKVADDQLLFTYGESDPVPGHVAKVILDDQGKISEVWVMTTAEEVPDKIYKLLNDNGNWYLAIALFENPDINLEDPFPCKSVKSH